MALFPTHRVEQGNAPGLTNAIPFYKVMSVGSRPPGHTNKAEGAVHEGRSPRRRRGDAVAVVRFPVDLGCIGYGKGPLTWIRQRKHKHLRRKIHICLLDYHPKGGRQSKFTEFWINERSRVCSASMNKKRIEDADVVWVHCKDPIPPNEKGGLLRDLKRG